MKILFICKYNRFRSKVAEALFLHYNKKNGIEVKSAGIMIDHMRPFVAKIVHDLLWERKIIIKDERSRLVDEQMIKWADKIIIAADNVPLGAFPAEKVEIWEIKDASEHKVDEVLISMAHIDREVQKLAGRIKV